MTTHSDLSDAISIEKQYFTSDFAQALIGFAPLTKYALALYMNPPWLEFALLESITRKSDYESRAGQRYPDPADLLPNPVVS